MKIKENKMINIDYLEKASKSSDFFNNLNSPLNNSLKKEFEGTEFEIKLSLTTVNSDLYEIWMNFSPTSPFIRRSMFRHRPFM